MDLAKLCSLKSASVQLLGATLLSSWWSRQEMCCHRARVSRGFEEMKTDKILSETQPRLSMVVLCCPISWPVWKLPTTMPDSAGCCTLRRPSCCLKGARRASHFCHAVPCRAMLIRDQKRSAVFCLARPRSKRTVTSLSLFCCCVFLCSSVCSCLFALGLQHFSRHMRILTGRRLEHKPVEGLGRKTWPFQSVLNCFDMFWLFCIQYILLHSVFIVPSMRKLKSPSKCCRFARLIRNKTAMHPWHSVTSFDVCKRSEPLTLTERKTSQAVFFRPYFLLSQMANLF